MNLWELRGVWECAAASQGLELMTLYACAHEFWVYKVGEGVLRIVHDLTPLFSPHCEDADMLERMLQSS